MSYAEALYVTVMTLVCLVVVAVISTALWMLGLFFYVLGGIAALLLIAYCVWKLVNEDDKQREEEINEQSDSAR